MGKIKVGINGYGRIARCILRSLEMRDTDIEIVGINVHSADTERMAYQFKYDSVFGRFLGDVETTEDALIINGKTIKVLSGNSPGNRIQSIPLFIARQMPALRAYRLGFRPCVQAAIDDTKEIIVIVAEAVVRSVIQVFRHPHLITDLHFFIEGVIAKIQEGRVQFNNVKRR